MDRFARLPRAALLIASLLATAPAWADSTACRERYPSVASQAAMLDVAGPPPNARTRCPMWTWWWPRAVAGT